MPAIRFYIGGRWTDRPGRAQLPVISPATESAFASNPIGAEDDVDEAVTAARSAFPAFSRSSRHERAALLGRIIEVYQARAEDLAQALSREMGAPIGFARAAQVTSGLNHLRAMEEVLADFAFECRQGETLVLKEPIGVCGLITPWNWPLNQIANKVAPALAAGCTMVLKPSELAPFAAQIFTEILEEAGVPPGVFNLVPGDATTGRSLASHPGVDMVSFTGSTRGGSAVAEAAAPTIKRVHQELGGKSADILLPDADLATAVPRGVEACFRNSGQSCSAPTRMLVQRAALPQAAELARRAADACRVGPPEDAASTIGPVVSRRQFERVQRLIAAGLEESGAAVAGGVGRPEGFSQGYYVRPTVFAPAANHQRIAREEVFGPVLCIIPYADEAEAVALANDSPYGLAAYIQGRDPETLDRVARGLQVGAVYVNHPPWDAHAPFGGYKQSGNGREHGRYGLEAYLEVKGVLGLASERGGRGRRGRAT